MANLKVVDADVLEADLTSVADSIRAKTGGEETLAFPSGFVSALESIEVGGGADEAWTEAERILTNEYTNYESLFSGKNLKEVPMQLLRNMESGQSYKRLFANNSELKEIPILNTNKNGADFSYMFVNDYALETIGGISIENANTMTDTFVNCMALKNIVFIGKITHPVCRLSTSPKLTHDSLMSAINALFDHKTAGTSGTFTLTLGSTNLAKLTDAEKAIATQRGWTLA